MSTSAAKLNMKVGRRWLYGRATPGFMDWETFKRVVDQAHREFFLIRGIDPDSLKRQGFERYGR